MVGFSGEVKLMTKRKSLAYVNYIPNIGDGGGRGGVGEGEGGGSPLFIRKCLSSSD